LIEGEATPVVGWVDRVTGWGKPLPSDAEGPPLTVWEPAGRSEVLLVVGDRRWRDVQWPMVLEAPVCSFARFVVE
jgi:hypothetical protein